MPRMCFWASVVMCYAMPWNTAAQDGPEYVVSFEVREAEQRVDVLVDGQPFTSYVYPDALKKPVLYPLRMASGTVVTRGYPLDPRPGERADHPHQVGLWFNYGDVNGLDFWNNSDAVPPEHASRMGTIRHRAVRSAEGGVGTGTLDVTMDWLRPDGTPLLREDTRFVFHAALDYRAVDRITTLTALHERVTFDDNKEGLLGLRVARALEHPSADSAQAGRTGRYTSRTGETGDGVWGTRSAWAMLTGIVDGEPVTVAILDHPKNPGFPTYWHARGYGLFAANPLGQAVFSDGAEALHFALEAGASVTFRHRVLLRSGTATPEQLEADYQAFAGASQ